MGVEYSTLLADYRASLHDAAKIFSDDSKDLRRHLALAAREVARHKRPRTLTATVTLVADQAEYEGVPEDLLLPKISQWGHVNVKPWLVPREPLPVIRVLDGTTRKLVLAPPPSSAQIAAFGATFTYYYLAAHTLDESANTTTIAAEDRDLVILRAQAEAMRELALRDAAKPVTLRGGNASGGAPKVGTPAALYQSLLAEFRELP